ncbi:phage portal protein family protein [Neisseria musculi]|uniref:phage portal protein family protein n=1 Tax=Neisseria musculi TaxID=1815583 RepID=UPI003EB9D7B4
MLRDNDCRIVDGCFNQLIWITDLNFGQNSPRPKFVLYEPEEGGKELVERDQFWSTAVSTCPKATGNGLITCRTMTLFRLLMPLSLKLQLRHRHFWLSRPMFPNLPRACRFRPMPAPLSTPSHPMPAV